MRIWEQRNDERRSDEAKFPTHLRSWPVANLDRTNLADLGIHSGPRVLHGSITGLVTVLERGDGAAACQW
jgi:hypothetical protein